MRACLKDINPAGKFVMLVFAMLSCLIMTMCVSSIFSYFLFDIVLFSADQEFLFANIDVLKFFQSVYCVGLFILPSFLLAYLFSYSVPEYLSLKKLSGGRLYFISFLLLLLSLPIVGFLNDINSNMHLPSFMHSIEEWMLAMEESAKITTEKFLHMNTLLGLFVNIIVLALLPALGEELLFRGVLQNLLHKVTNNIHWSILLAAVAFSAFHLQFYGFLPRMALGILFGYLLFWSGSIYLAIFAHFLNNALAVISSYIVQNNLVSSDFNSFIEQNVSSVYVLVFCFTGAYFCLKYLYRRAERC